jgi:hypothetical protein
MVQRHKLSDLQAVAQSNGGECLSQTYNTVLDYYECRCKAGHEWETQGRKVFGGSWCIDCFFESRRGSVLPEAQKQKSSATKISRSGYTIEDLHAVAIERGGECLSRSWSGFNAMYSFRCKCGWEWTTSATSVLGKRKSWCRSCSARKVLDMSPNRKSLDDLQRAAISLGGLCLSSAFTTVNDYYNFICKRGHEWSTRGGSVLSGMWCRRASNPYKSENACSL